MQYTEILKLQKKKFFISSKIFDIFLIFAQNRDYVYTLEPPRECVHGEAVLMGTHNLCFEAKIRKIGIPL